VGVGNDARARFESEDNISAGPGPTYFLDFRLDGEDGETDPIKKSSMSRDEQAIKRREILLAGPAPWLADYGLGECPEPSYVARRWLNVQEADTMFLIGDCPVPGRGTRGWHRPSLAVGSLAVFRQLASG
jgi:hypothetical protein